MKRRITAIVSIILCLCIVSTNCMAFSDSERLESMSESVSVILSDTPIFQTYLFEDNEDQDLRSEANRRIEDALRLERHSEPIEITTSSMVIREVVSDEKALLFNEMEYLPTLERAANLKRHGVTISSINFYLFADTERATTLGVGDAAYWENRYNLLGTYNGYKFLYADSATTITTSWVEPDNLTGSMNWVSLAANTLRSICDVFVEGSFYSAVTVANDLMSTIFSAYTPPYSVTYSNAFDSEFYIRVKGTLYVRTVFIKDINNRIPGYAYYAWATTEQSRLQQGYDLYYPIGKISNYAYLYNDLLESGTLITASTPGFSGNASFYSRVISSYNNLIGYFPCEETIDITSVLTSLL